LQVFAIYLHGVYIGSVVPWSTTSDKHRFNLRTSHIIMMFNTELSNAGHSRRFVLGNVPLGGWELLIEEDNAIVSRVHYTDWHRVERALAAVTRRISELEAGGWRTLVRDETTAP
jgi:hypothetical protein